MRHRTTIVSRAAVFGDDVFGNDVFGDDVFFLRIGDDMFFLGIGGEIPTRVALFPPEVGKSATISASQQELQILMVFSRYCSVKKRRENCQFLLKTYGTSGSLISTILRTFFGAIS